MKFNHLHVHTEYSLLDGACRIQDAVQLAASMGMNALAITDHGTMYGAVRFYEACKTAGIKPIIGCEVYVARGSRLRKTDGLRDRPFHLILLAETMEGYRNLMKIVSCGFLEGFYYRPRVDLEVLSKYSKGIIALTACQEGEISELVRSGRLAQASLALRRYLGMFGRQNVFVEIQRNGVVGQEEVNSRLVELARKEKVGIVATNDCHYLRREDAAYHEVLLAIQTGATMKDKDRFRFAGDQFYLRSPEEMATAFSDLPEAVENTEAIAERCNVTLDMSSIHLPSFPLPPGENASEKLKSMAYAGLMQRTSGKPDAVRLERLDRELAMIDRMGYSSYFLIVHDFVSYAKRQGIAVGPGRGSAAGSLVSYVLGITNIDPVEHDLVFERFLNPERVTMPDIDIDFQDDRRDEVIQYVRDKYGHDRVAQIVTFGTMAAKAAVRDVGRALALPYSEVDRVAKLIPNQIGITIDKALEMVPELQEMARSRPEVARLIDTSRKIEGMPRHPSTHAAGIVIGKGPLWDDVPLATMQEGQVVTQYAMEDLEALGLLKFDFLALRTLTVIKNAVDLVKEDAGKPLDLDRLPLGDRKTYDMLAKGDAIGVFQLESSWVRDFLKELKPETFSDLIATVALCRPGPMQQIPEFIKARMGKPKYLHPILEPILKETYGVLVYQEQILKIAAEVAGFTLGEADILRRAVGKKKRDLLVEAQAKFMKGAAERGLSRETAERIYDLILKFANYGFNKNHAAPYALIAYQTAYLKANYPLEFMAALLSSVAGAQGKVGIYLEEARRMGIGVLGPDVNRSRVRFSVEGSSIRYGLGSIKNVGSTLAAAIEKERKIGGEFSSLADLASRVDPRHLTRKALESLIQCGACDGLGTRYENLAQLESVLVRRPAHVQNQVSLFGEPTIEKPAVTRSASNAERVPLEVRLSWEKELLGMYFSGHPLEKYKEVLGRAAKPIAEIHGMQDGDEVSVGGQVTSLKKVVTRSREEMAFVTIEDEFDDVEVIVFPRLWRTVKPLLIRDAVVIVRGTLEEQDEARRILAKDVILAKGEADSPGTAEEH